jgi:RNA polymerase sigma factor (sigma-70 family)
MTDDPRAELVEALRGGDERAWRTLVDDYGRLIYSVAARSGLDAADRDEVFQSTCLIAVRSIDGLRDPTRLSSWLYGIAYRLSAEVHRRRRRIGSELDVDDERLRASLETRSDAPGDALERLEETGRLLDALAAIDARCGALVRILYLEEPRPPYEEIGERLGMPVGSIGPTRARCLDKLRRALEEREDADADSAP